MGFYAHEDGLAACAECPLVCHRKHTKDAKKANGTTKAAAGTMGSVGANPKIRHEHQSHEIQRVFVDYDADRRQGDIHNVPRLQRRRVVRVCNCILIRQRRPLLLQSRRSRQYLRRCRRMEGRCRRSTLKVSRKEDGRTTTKRSYSLKHPTLVKVWAATPAARSTRRRRAIELFVIQGGGIERLSIKAGGKRTSSLRRVRRRSTFPRSTVRLGYSRDFGAGQNSAGTLYHPRRRNSGVLLGIIPECSSPSFRLSACRLDTVRVSANLLRRACCSTCLRCCSIRSSS